MIFASIRFLTVPVLLSSIASAQDDPWQREAKYHEKNVVTILDADGVFDPETGRILTNRNVYIEDDRILAIRPKTERRPAGARLIRLPGRIIAPGFIHCGNPEFVAPTSELSNRSAHPQAEAGPSPWLTAGFTTICKIDEGDGSDPLLMSTSPRSVPSEQIHARPNLLLRFQRTVARAGLPALYPAHRRSDLIRAIELRAHAIECYIALDPDILREIRMQQIALLPGASAVPGFEQSLQRAARAGVPIAVGGTQAIDPRTGPLEAIIRMQKLGLSPIQAMGAATLGSARLARLPQRGRIVPGYYADLIAPPIEAFHNLDALADLDFVMRSGELVVEPFTLRDPGLLAHGLK